ncbi:hypothetical protein FQZ97_934040 [compost metagenome]
MVIRQVEDPVGVDDRRRLRPADGRFASRHHDDGVGLVVDGQQLQRLFLLREVLGLLRTPVFTLNVIGDRTYLGVWVQPENVFGVSIIRKLFGKRLLLDLAGDFVLADIANHRTPVSTFLV